VELNRSSPAPGRVITPKKKLHPFAITSIKTPLNSFLKQKYRSGCRTGITQVGDFSGLSRFFLERMAGKRLAGKRRSVVE
jgi:hypothetical protein